MYFLWYVHWIITQRMKPFSPVYTNVHIMSNNSTGLLKSTIINKSLLFLLLSTTQLSLTISRKCFVWPFVNYYQMPLTTKFKAVMVTGRFSSKINSPFLKLSYPPDPLHSILKPPFDFSMYQSIMLLKKIQICEIVVLKFWKYVDNIYACRSRGVLKFWLGRFRRIYLKCL